jgi:hypothetical protein
MDGWMDGWMGRGGTHTVEFDPAGILALGMPKIVVVLTVALWWGSMCIERSETIVYRPRLPVPVAMFQTFLRGVQCLGGVVDLTFVAEDRCDAVLPCAVEGIGDALLQSYEGLGGVAGAEVEDEEEAVQRRSSAFPTPVPELDGALRALSG